MNRRVHSDSFTTKPDNAPRGWYLIVTYFPNLQMATVKSEVNGKEYSVIL